MASLDIQPEIGRAYQKIVSGAPFNKPSSTYAQWAVFSVSAPLQNAFVQSSAKASTLKVQSAGGQPARVFCFMRPNDTPKNS